MKEGVKVPRSAFEVYQRDSENPEDYPKSFDRIIKFANGDLYCSAEFVWNKKQWPKFQFEFDGDLYLPVTHALNYLRSQDQADAIDYLIAYLENAVDAIGSQTLH